jgi:AcrR family transcriptional regulator
MSVEDRKAAILSVVIPLIARNGASVTTADIAEAAGVAEGTLYRVFPDKITLLIEAVRTAIDPTEITDAMDAIDSTLSLEQKLRMAFVLLVARVTAVTALINAIRSLPHTEHAQHAGAQRFVAESEAAISASLTRLITPHAKELSVDPAKAATALRGIVLAAAHPVLTHGEPLSADDAISILLVGIVSKDVI